MRYTTMLFLLIVGIVLACAGEPLGFVFIAVAALAAFAQ